MLKTHKIDIHPNPQELMSEYKWEAICSCQWQALASSREIAEDHVRVHLGNHGVRLPQQAAEVKTPLVEPEPKENFRDW